MEVSPGDTGNIEAPFENGPDSGDVEHDVRMFLVAPSFIVTDSSVSKLGPVDIQVGQTYTFNLHYDVAPSAPLGCVKAFVKFDVPGGAVDPDPEDDATPVEFVVLPSTGSRGRLRAKFRAALDCRKRLDAAEVPIRKTACRHKIEDALQQVRFSTEAVRPLFFTDGDRTRRALPTPAVFAEARMGSIPAILELGFRKGRRVQKTLRELARGPSPESLLRSLADRTWECDAFVVSKRIAWGGSISAANQALARLGDDKEFESLRSGLNSKEPNSFARSVAALAYVGNQRAADALTEALSNSAPQNAQQEAAAFELVQALESMRPDVAHKIQSESAGPTDKLQRWRQWAMHSNP